MVVSDCHGCSKRKKTGYKGDITVKYDSALKRQRQEDGESEATLGSKQIESSKERGRKEEKKHRSQSCALALHSYGMAAHLIFDQCSYNCLLVGF